jgi:hypothetical protein
MFLCPETTMNIGKFVLGGSNTVISKLAFAWFLWPMQIQRKHDRTEEDENGGKTATWLWLKYKDDRQDGKPPHSVQVPDSSIF